MVELPIVTDVIIASKSLWHRVFGHPRPYRYVGDDTYCAGCDEYIKSF